MHALTFSNPRAVATLWIRFVRELRFAHWEALTPLPRMDVPQAAGRDEQLTAAPGVHRTRPLLRGFAGVDGAAHGCGAHTLWWPGCQLRSAERLAGAAERAEAGGQPPDLRCSLLEQKLQMLNACIRLRISSCEETQGGQEQEVGRMLRVARSGSWTGRSFWRGTARKHTCIFVRLPGARKGWVGVRQDEACCWSWASGEKSRVVVAGVRELGKRRRLSGDFREPNPDPWRQGSGAGACHSAATSADR